MARQSNILLIVPDDLRLDLPWHQYARDTAPRLNQRLAEATIFENCYTPVGWTLPSCATILTGLLPEQHGLIDHNHQHRQPKLGHYLGSDYTRIGIANNGNLVSDQISDEYLKAIGFKRRPAKWSRFGWDRGFDEYKWTHLEDHETPFEQARAALRAFGRSPRDKPFFLFFHTNIVHDYHFDRPYYRKAAFWIGHLDERLYEFRDGAQIWREPPTQLSTAELTRQIKAKYDAGILHLDSVLDQLLDLVDFNDTIVVLISDHGEGFAPELGRVHHCGRLHEDLIHVPLVIWLPPGLRAELCPRDRESRFCSTVDIVPTLLRLIGKTQGNLPGRFLYDLPEHREICGSDRGYVFWNDDCVRESYDECDIEIRSTLTYPIKTISVRRNSDEKYFQYNLAYDPDERHNLLGDNGVGISNFEPVTFVSVVNDFDELKHNLLASTVKDSSIHEWILIDNVSNKLSKNITELYCDALDRARNDLVFFMHQDLYLPPGWEYQMFSALSELEEKHPSWGVLGSVGVLPFGIDGFPFRGHWADPMGYKRIGPLPHQVQSLDELWIGLRRSSGVRFDTSLPGFHCYGMDICLTAEMAGRRSYAIDAFVWHKFRDSAGKLIERSAESPKIMRRQEPEFVAEMQISSEFVARKWTALRPFRSTSQEWRA